MPRVKRGVTARARHKKIIKMAKGYRGRRSNVYRIAKQAVMRAGQYAYRDRRNKKRVFRALWIFFFQAEDGIRDLYVTEFRRVLFRSQSVSVACCGNGLLLETKAKFTMKTSRF